MGALHTRQFNIIAITIVVLCVAGYTAITLNANRASATVRTLGGEMIADRESRSTPRVLVPVEQLFGNFASFDKLTNIAIISDRLLDSHVNEIATAKDVEYLTLSGENLTDETCRAISSLKRLSRVEIESDRLTDDGVSALAELLELRVLYVHSNSIKGECFTALAKGLNLAQLEVHGDSIRNASIRELQRSRIDTLILSGLGITDEAIESLASLSSVMGVCVDGTSISADGIARLAKRRPDLDIFHAPLKQPPLRYTKDNILNGR